MHVTGSFNSTFQGPELQNWRWGKCTMQVFPANRTNAIWGLYLCLSEVCLAEKAARARNGALKGGDKYYN